jgi:hypothetical protein
MRKEIEYIKDSTFTKTELNKEIKNILSEGK